MFFAKTLAAFSAFTLAQALVALTNEDYKGIIVGQPFNVTWNGQVGTVTLKLKTGDPDNQILVSIIAAGLTGNSYIWVPADDIPEAVYNLQIDDSNGDINYSPQFEILNDIDLPYITASTPFPFETSSTTVIVPSTTTTVVPALSTGPSYSQNMTTSVIYSNSSMTSVSYVAPSTTASVTPPPAASTVVTAGAFRHAVEPLAAMLLGAAGIAFLF